MADIVIDLDKIQQSVGENEEMDFVSFLAPEGGGFKLMIGGLLKNRPHAGFDDAEYQAAYNVGENDIMTIRKDGYDYTFTIAEVIDISKQNGVDESTVITRLINNIDDGVPADLEKVAQEAALDDVMYKLNNVSDMHEYLEEKKQLVAEADPETQREIKNLQKVLNDISEVKKNIAESNVDIQNELTDYFKSRNVEPELASLMADYIMAGSDDEGIKAKNALIEYVKGNNQRQADFYEANVALLELVNSVGETIYYSPILEEVGNGVQDILENHFPERGMKPGKGGQSLA